MLLDDEYHYIYIGRDISGNKIKIQKKKTIAAIIYHLLVQNFYFS